MLDSGFRLRRIKLDARYSMLDTGCSMRDTLREILKFVDIEQIYLYFILKAESQLCRDGYFYIIEQRKRPAFLPYLLGMFNLNDKFHGTTFRW